MDMPNSFTRTRRLGWLRMSDAAMMRPTKGALLTFEDGDSAFVRPRPTTPEAELRPTQPAIESSGGRIIETIADMPSLVKLLEDHKVKSAIIVMSDSDFAATAVEAPPIPRTWREREIERLAEAVSHRLQQMLPSTRTSVSWRHLATMPWMTFLRRLTTDWRAPTPLKQVGSSSSTVRHGIPSPASATSRSV